MFANRIVPVSLKDGGETERQLANLIWSGKDKDTGKPISLYGMVVQPRAEDVEEPF